MKALIVLLATGTVMLAQPPAPSQSAAPQAPADSPLLHPANLKAKAPDNFSAALEIPTENFPQKIDVLSLFDIGVVVRNKTKAHGAKLPDQKSKAAPLLHTAFTAIYGNMGLFARPWAYLHRNLSGRYKVSAICGSPRSTARHWIG